MQNSLINQFNLQSILNPYNFKLKNLILSRKTSEKIFTNNEILIIICGFLEEKEILVLMRVNKYLQKLPQTLPKLEIRLLKYELKTTQNKLTDQKMRSSIQDHKNQCNNLSLFNQAYESMKLKGTASISPLFQLLKSKNSEISKHQNDQKKCDQNTEEIVFHMSMPLQYQEQIENLQKEYNQTAMDNFFFYQQVKRGVLDSDTKLVLELKQEIYECLREDQEEKSSKLKILPKLLFTNPYTDTTGYLKTQLEWIEVKQDIKNKTGHLLKETGKLLCPAVHIKNIYSKIKGQNSSSSSS